MIYIFLCMYNVYLLADAVCDIWHLKFDKMTQRSEFEYGRWALPFFWVLADRSRDTQEIILAKRTFLALALAWLSDRSPETTDFINGQHFLDFGYSLTGCRDEAYYINEQHFLGFGSSLTGPQSPPSLAASSKALCTLFGSSLELQKRKVKVRKWKFSAHSLGLP